MRGARRWLTGMVLTALLALHGYAQTEGEKTVPPEITGAAADEATDATRQPDPVLDALDREFDRAETGATPGGVNAAGGDTPSPDEVDGVQIFRVLGGLCFVLGAIIALGYLVRRYGGKTPILAGAQLGQVMGKVYLNPKSSLVYVRSGGRVLLLGLTQTQITLVTEFDAAAFDDQLHAEEPTRDDPANGVSFLSQMRSTTARMTAPSLADDADIDSIRGDLQRLQQFLEESKRDGEA